VQGPLSGPGKAPVIVFYRMQFSLDLPPLARLFFTNPAAVAEMYEHVMPQPAGTFMMRLLAVHEAVLPDWRSSAHAHRMHQALTKLLDDRMEEELAPDDLNRLCARVAAALRHHPLVERPAGVRGARDCVAVVRRATSFPRRRRRRSCRRRRRTRPRIATSPTTTSRRCARRPT